MEDQSNVIFNLVPTQKPSSVSWLVLKQILKSGGEVKTSGYTVKIENFYPSGTKEKKINKSKTGSD